MERDTDTQQGGLLRLAAAARKAGLSTSMLRYAMRSGAIPLTPIAVGSIIHVRASELNAWLNPPTTNPNGDLFQ